MRIRSNTKIADRSIRDESSERVVIRQSYGRVGDFLDLGRYSKSLGPDPVGVHCPLTSSLGEFPGYWESLWYPGLLPVLVSIAFPFAFHISRCFSIHSSSPAIGFHSCFFFKTEVSAAIRPTLHLLPF